MRRLVEQSWPHLGFKSTCPLKEGFTKFIGYYSLSIGTTFSKALAHLSGTLSAMPEPEGARD